MHTRQTIDRVDAALIIAGATCPHCHTAATADAGPYLMQSPDPDYPTDTGCANCDGGSTIEELGLSLLAIEIRGLYPPKGA